jgi:sugar phosphate isomerase/epimerase
MKIGVKTYYDPYFVEHFQDKADFIEIMAIGGKDYSFVKNIKIPVIIHAMHSVFGVNPSDPLKEKTNLEAINFAIDLANKTHAKKIIVHSGPLENSNCTQEIAENFLKKIKDKRILLENHGYHGERFPGLFIKPDEIMLFLNKTHKGFCLDVNHAISYAIAANIDYIYFLKQLLKLNPAHFHLGGQKFNPCKEHLDFSDSDVDLKKVFAILPDDAEITLEVSKEIDRTEKDLEIIRNILKK